MPRAPTSETLNQPTEQMFNVGNPSLFGNKTINNQ